MNVGKFSLAAAFCLSLAGTDPAVAQEKKYPHDVVTLITHSSPGGGSDVFLREMIRYLEPHMGVKFVVENVRGGSGARALARLATAPADGSVFYATTPTYIYTSLMSNPEHTFRDVDPLVNFFLDPEVIFTRADGPFQTLEDVIQHARENRGRWGAANPASLERQSLEMLKRVAGINPAIVSHEGGGDMMINVLNGTLDIGVGEMQELRSQVAAGNLRLLAVLTEDRLEDLPDLPTVQEAGYDVVVTKFRGLAAPKGLPADVIAAWEEGVSKLLESPDYKAVYSQESLIPAFKPHAEYKVFMEKFAADTEAFLKESGVIQ